MNKITRILGKRGRTTLPYEIRQKLGMCSGDIISFEEKDDDSILIRRERLCESYRPSCRNEPVRRPNDEESLLDFLDGLSPTEQRAALIHLSVQWAAHERGRNHD